MAFIYNLTDSWNDVTTTWNGIKLAVTNTSSDASSKLLNLTVSGATTASFVVDKSGNLVLNGSVNKVTITAPATAATFTLADGSTFATVGAHSVTFTATGTTALTLPTSGTVTALGNTTTGSGSIVLATSPTLVTPNLGTPSAATLTNCTGYPAGSISGLGTGVATWLATPSSSNLAAAVTDETGSGSLVFATSPTLVTPNLGTPSAATLTNATGLPISTGVSGLGSGIATFLATPSSANLKSAVTDETGSGPLVFATSPTFTSDVTLGTQSTTQGSLVLANTAAGSKAVTVKSSNSTSAAYSLTLPTTAGTNGYFLQTDGTGVLSWAAGGGGGGGSVAGADTQVQFNDAGSFGAAAAFTYLKTTNTLQLGVASTSSGALKLYNSASANAITVASGNNSAAWTMTLPTSAGTNGYLLQTDGSGNTSWVTPPATGLTVGTTSITGGTSGRILYDNAGTLGEKTVTGTGDVVLATSPTLTTPNLGTPSAATLTNATGLPLTTGVTGVLPIANGGTGSNLTDPNADRLMFWDDSANAVAWLTPAAGVEISDTTFNGNKTPTTQIFTTTGSSTWTKPSGCRTVIVEVIAGGGGGGGVDGQGASNYAAAGGGGGGGYSRKRVDVTAVSTVTVTVGTGGAGGTAGANNGSTGGTSSFGAYASATGGGGGQGRQASTAIVIASGGTAGAGADGDINGGGSSGFIGNWATDPVSGNGGSLSPYGSGARGVNPSSNTTTAGANATGYGAGGSGACSKTSTDDAAGGNGSQGIVIVWEYY